MNSLEKISIEQVNLTELEPCKLKTTVGGDNITQFVFKAFGRYHRMLENAYSNGYGRYAVM